MRAQCSHASVGLAQARPNDKTVKTVKITVANVELPHFTLNINLEFV